MTNDDETAGALVALGMLLDPAQVAHAQAALDQARTDPWWLPYQVHPPLGESGNVRVARRTTTEAEALLLNLNRKNELLRGWRAYPGTWTFLLLNGETWMSDTPDEIADHLPFIHAAEANVLVTGLGLGVVTQALLRKPSVRRVDVVEYSAHVARLIGPTFAADERFHLHVADAWTWTPPEGVVYDHAWHDIWQQLDPANIPEFERMRARYRGVARNQACWAEEYVREFARIRRAHDRAPRTKKARERLVRDLRLLNARRHAPPSFGRGQT